VVKSVSLIVCDHREPICLINEQNIRVSGADTSVDIVL
jgi:hypothetical protein